MGDGSVQATKTWLNFSDRLDLDVHGNVRRLLRTGSNLTEFLFLWCRPLDRIRHTGTDAVGPDQEDHSFPEVLPIAEVCTASLGPGLALNTREIDIFWLILESGI